MGNGSELTKNLFKNNSRQGAKDAEEDKKKITTAKNHTFGSIADRRSAVGTEVICKPSVFFMISVMAFLPFQPITARGCSLLYVISRPVRRISFTKGLSLSNSDKGNALGSRHIYLL